MNDNPFGHFGSGGLHDLTSGAEDPYAGLNIPMGDSMGVGVGFDFFAATMAASAIQAHAHQKEHNPMSISPPKVTLDVLATAVQPDSISPPILTSTTGTSPGGGSASNSPLIGTTAGTAPNNNGARRPSIPAIGMTVTSPTGITLPAAFSNPAAFTGGMLGSADTSYFPSQSVRTSPPPVPTVQTTPPPPSTSSILANSRARSKTATSGLSAASSTASANVTRGYFPQPAQPFPPFVPNAAQQTPAFGTLTISYKPQIRTPLADPNRSLSSFQETLVFYYFNRGVRRMQYLLADDSTTGVTDVMYDLVIRDPLG